MIRATPGRGSAARPDAIRRHNLALILGHVHRDGFLTRAELTQRLGVSRSTIAALVADLIELGLVTESVPTGGDRVGRPSHVVGPREDGPYVVAVDVDVSQVITAAIGIGGDVLARQVVITGAEACGAE
ncbi:MAG TPA: helix-turn-helix domain-containing protein, partial [Nocardioidaceae bacterium]|nr:helix-turn-helix domain-containing protein [Nocardioidaceae bacterium]